MTESVNLGLDFGSLGCRAAYLAGEEVCALRGGAAWSASAPWLLCEAAPDFMPAVRFPSLKNRLGMEVLTAGSETPSAATVRQVLNDLRIAAEAESGRSPGQLVITVPATFSSSRRTALRELALSSRFQDVHLLNDGMAAAIAYLRHVQQPSTVLVYSMGYAGFEVALIRAAKDRYRALAYDGADSVGGRVFDSLILQSCFQRLQAEGMWSPEIDLGRQGWLHFRDSVQRLREMVSTKDLGTLNVRMSVSGLVHSAALSLMRTSFEESIADMIQRTFSVVERTLDDARITARDLDQFLMVGGLSRMPHLQRALARRFSRDPVVLPENSLAVGAALYASRLSLASGGDGGALPGLESGIVESRLPPVPMGFLATDAAPETALSTVGLSFDLSSAQAGSAESSGRGGEPDAESRHAVVDRQRSLDYARRLIDKGLYDRATGYLQGLIEDAQIVLKTIPAGTTAQRPKETDRVQQLAEEAILSGRYQEAVELSHQAYALDPESPQVFQNMLEIHCRAALANQTMEGYNQSIKWLKCAYDHDRTNGALHQRIADRDFIHARQAIEKGDTPLALRALDECLYFDPEHAAAFEMRTTLSGKTADNRRRNVAAEDHTDG